MSLDARAASMNRDEIVALLKKHEELQRSQDALRHTHLDLEQIHIDLERSDGELQRAHLELQRVHIDLEQSHAELARQVAWFRQQLFGSKSERRLVDPSGRQLTLGEIFRSEDATVSEIEVPAHRRRSPKPTDSETTDSPLRFDPSVPVEEIEVANPELEGADLSEYDVVGQKVTERLAQRPGSYVVLRFVRKVYRHKRDESFSCPPAPPAVLEKSVADVSLLAGILIDKFMYHLPLYRQHQRMAAAGVHLARSSLTNWVHRVGDLCEPIYEAHVRSILSSQVLAMDETPIKAGRKEGKAPKHGAMKTAYFWPIWGDRNEVAFPFATTRGSVVVQEALRSYVGVLLTDGYRVYDAYTKTVDGTEHAQCWSHTRRHFVEAESSDPERAGAVLDRIAEIYQAEALLPGKGCTPEEVLALRCLQVKPLVDLFFEDLEALQSKTILLPSSPLRKALAYAREREAALRVFLRNPGVPMDTNHLERAIRPVAIGRNNWLFCWTEVGAKYVGIFQSLLSTCRVQGIDPYVYLVDVLQRINTHPAARVAELTPRLWKEHFGVDLLVIDDFGLDAMDPAESRDAYEILTGRHRRASTLVTSNRAPDEWLQTFADPVRAQSAIDRFTSSSYDLVIEGESYRWRLKPKVGSGRKESN